MSVDGRRTYIKKEKIADLKISGFAGSGHVSTGPKISITF